MWIGNREQGRRHPPVDQRDVVGVHSDDRAFGAVGEQVDRCLDPSLQQRCIDADFADQPRDEHQHGRPQPFGDAVAVELAAARNRFAECGDQLHVAVTRPTKIGKCCRHTFGKTSSARGVDRIGKAFIAIGGAQRIPALGRIGTGLAGLKWRGPSASGEKDFGRGALPRARSLISVAKNPAGGENARCSMSAAA